MIGLFQAGKPVVGTRLIGREDVIEKILQLLAAGQSVVLIAPRRYGKTSVLLEVLSRAKKRNLFTAYVDIFSTATKRILAEKITESVLGNKALDKAFMRFRKNVVSLLKQMQLRKTIEDFEFILTFAEATTDQNELLLNSIDFIERFSAKYNSRIICGFDEFADIEKLDSKEIVKLFRSRIQLQQHASYIFSGSYESVMNQLFITSNAPFYRFAQVIKIGNIPPAIFSQYIQRAFSKIGVSIAGDSLNLLLRFSDGHPYYTQVICRQLEYFCSVKNVNTVKTDDVYKAVDEAFWGEINYIERLWEEISTSKELSRVLITIAGEVASIYTAVDAKKVNIPRALRNLRVKGIIEKVDQKYTILDPMLRYFIRRSILEWDSRKCF